MWVFLFVFGKFTITSLVEREDKKRRNSRAEWKSIPAKENYRCKSPEAEQSLAGPKTEQGASQAALVVKNPPASAGDARDGFDPLVGKIPWRRAWHPPSGILAWRTPWTEEPGRLSFPLGVKCEDEEERVMMAPLLSHFQHSLI